MDWNTALLLLSACVSCSLSLPVSEAQPDSDPFYYGRHYGRHYGHGYGGYRRYGYGHHGHYGYRRHGYGYGYGRHGKSYSHGNYYGGYKQPYGHGYEPVKPKPVPVPVPSPLPAPLPIEDIDLPQGPISVLKPELPAPGVPVPSPLPAPVPIEDIDLPQGPLAILKPELTRTINRIDPSELIAPGLVVPVDTNQLDVPVNKLAVSILSIPERRLTESGNTRAESEKTVTQTDNNLVVPENVPAQTDNILSVPTNNLVQDTSSQFLPVPAVPVPSASVVRSVQVPVVPEEREVFVPELTSFPGLEPVPAVPGLPVLS